jgi:16S rRNA (uracil1498-N3)-methyltransferase
MGDPNRSGARDGRYRFFVAPQAVVQDRVSFDPAQVRQLRTVLRLHTGDRILACPNDGTEVLVELDATYQGHVVERRLGVAEPRCAVWLYQSALRGDRFTWFLQKATEIGVSGIVPVIFHRTQPADYLGRHHRYRLVVREAAEQCGRTRLPEVFSPLRFTAALAHSAQQMAGMRLLLDETEQTTTLRSVAGLAACTSVAVFAGPEGGLTDPEREAAQGMRVLPVSLGRRILRSETAGLVAAALALAAAGDLG